MRKPAAVVYAALIGGAIWLFLQNFDIEGLEGIQFKKRAADTTYPVSINSAAPPVERSGETIRVASFNIQVFGRSKIGKSHVMDVLARIVRHFDIVAIQEIRARDQDIIPRFVELINAAGRQYDYVIGPRLGRSDSKEQYAYIFDRASIEVDRRQLYTIDDSRQDLLHREPLVGWFRVRGPAPGEAFTFSLVNVHTDPDEVEEEMNVMDEVFRAVRDDGRNEDDVILLGDFNADERKLGDLGRMPGITWAISGVPTNVRRTELYDNLIFHGQATNEFVGRAGVFDFLRQYNLTQEEALEVSDHFPVWAEFSIYEGGTAARVATLPE